MDQVQPQPQRCTGLALAPRHGHTREAQLQWPCHSRASETLHGELRRGPPGAKQQFGTCFLPAVLTLLPGLCRGMHRPPPLFLSLGPADWAPGWPAPWRAL